MSTTWCPLCGRPDGAGHDAGSHRHDLLELPRYCSACGRRMVVQVTPARWFGRCSEHGERTS